MRKSVILTLIIAGCLCSACATATPTPAPVAPPPPTAVPPTLAPTALPTPIPTPVPTAEPAPTEPAPVKISPKLEFVAYGQVACGGISPVPGCVYTLLGWVGEPGPIEPGHDIKVMIMTPESMVEGELDVESCTPQVDREAYTWTESSVVVRVRGEICHYHPERLFCICDPDDYLRLIK